MAVAAPAAANLTNEELATLDEMRTVSRNDVRRPQIEITARIFAQANPTFLKLLELTLERPFAYAVTKENVIVK